MKTLQPIGDHRGSADYRLAVAKSLVAKFLVGAPGGGGMTIAGKPVPHESAREHVTGEALYTDDLVQRFPRALHAWPVMCAARARAGQDSMRRLRGLG